MTDKLPVKWEERLAQEAKEVAKNERPKVSRISLRAGVMTLMEQKIPGNKLDVVILGSVMQRLYYSKPFDANKPDAPDCFAFSETGEDMVPHEKAFDKQNETCLGCPQNEWGSATRSPSGRGKACRESRKLLLLPADALKEGNVKTAELATVDIPVTSVKYWANYVNMLSGTEARPPWAVITQFGVEPDSRTQIKVNFVHRANIAEEFLNALYERMMATKDILIIPYEKTSEGLAPQTEAMQTGRKY
jgi:hypothetical protein